MKTTLRRVGNSTGLIIPSAMLAECGLQRDIELTVENGRLIIAPAQPPRAGWFANRDATDDADAWEGIRETDVEQQDWQW